MTPELLVASRIGRSLNSARKTLGPASEANAAAKAILRGWKDLVPAGNKGKVACWDAALSERRR